MIKRLNYIISAILLFILTGCAPYQKVSNNNVAFLYYANKNRLHPEYFIYHNSDTTSLLYFQININELIFSKINTQPSKARVKVHYELYNSFNSTEIIDSSSVLYAIEKNTPNNLFKSSISVSTNNDQKYFLKVETRDQLNGKRSFNFIQINKPNTDGNENFMAISALNQFPYFKNYFNNQEIFNIKCDRKKIDKIFVSYFNKSFHPAGPPFSVISLNPAKIEPDSIWTYNYNDTLDFNLPYEGFYFFQTDTTSNDGITFFNFGNFYPELRTAPELIKPLRYLTTTEEFNDLLLSNTKKDAVDNFWLNKAEKPEKAKELIKAYYNRIKMSNIYFQSYKEGWKTDRGMIYTIYGPPPTIHKTDDSEIWTYGGRTNLPTISFTFIKIENKFTDNDYELIRQNFYKSNWNKAVETWRSGHIYSIIE